VNHKLAAFVGLAVLLAALFVRLGFWQLNRLEERTAHVDGLRARLRQPVVAFDQLPDTQSFRRAILRGTPDDEHEIVFAGRSRNGSPGVYILTPVRRASSDTAVIVIRGWVYSPDAATVDLPRWRESRSEFSGYVSGLASTVSASTPTPQRRIRSLSSDDVRALLPYPVADRYLVAQDSAPAGAPVRLAAPTLNNGPHLSYAIQWFAFATIATVGALVVVMRARRTAARGATGA
jgi:surfeit locus 1 family protein